MDHLGQKDRFWNSALTSVLGFCTPWTICAARWIRWDLYLCRSHFRPKCYSSPSASLFISENVART